MIHFDFIVSDAEGEIIFDGIQQLIVRDLVLMRKETMGENRKEYIEAFEKHVEFLEALKGKMKNKQVST